MKKRQLLRLSALAASALLLPLAGAAQEFPPRKAVRERKITGE